MMRGGRVIRMRVPVWVTRYESSSKHTTVLLPKGAEGVAYRGHPSGNQELEGYKWVDFDQGFKRWVREAQLEYVGAPLWSELEPADKQERLHRQALS